MAARSNFEQHASMRRPLPQERSDVFVQELDERQEQRLVVLWPEYGQELDQDLLGKRDHRRSCATRLAFAFERATSRALGPDGFRESGQRTRVQRRATREARRAGRPRSPVRCNAQLARNCRVQHRSTKVFRWKTNVSEREMGRAGLIPNVSAGVEVKVDPAGAIIRRSKSEDAWRLAESNIGGRTEAFQQVGQLERSRPDTRPRDLAKLLPFLAR